MDSPLALETSKKMSKKGREWPSQLYESLKYDAKIKTLVRPLPRKLTSQINDKDKLKVKSDIKKIGKLNTKEPSAPPIEEEFGELEPEKNSVKILNWLFENPKISVNNLEDSKGEIVQGVEGLLSPQEFSQLKSPQWRLTINGQSFTIQMNQDKGDSFYRSLAQALTNNEENRDSIREQLCHHVLQDDTWPVYMEDIKDYYIRRKSKSISIHTKSKKITKVYKSDRLKKKKPGSYFELRAASNLFNFNFSLIFKRNNWFTWLNYQKQKDNLDKKFYFLIWPNETNKSGPLWKLLIPLQNSQIDKETLDGDYPLYMRRTFDVNKCCFTHDLSTRQKGQIYPSIWSQQNKVITFQAGNEELCYPSHNENYPQDLFAMLSIIFFGNIYHTEEIWQEIIEHRKRFDYFMNLNPRRKYSSNNNVLSKELIGYSSSQLGDVMDLKIAASLYKFCFTLISMDTPGNLSMSSECRDPEHDHLVVPYLAFFTRGTSTQHLWFKLEIFVGHNNGPRLSDLSQMTVKGPNKKRFMDEFSAINITKAIS